MAYVAQARSRKLIAELEALGIGEVTQPSEYPPRRHPWFLDNGAFLAFKSGAAFDAERFMGAVERTVIDDNRPDFIIVPDIVAGGSESARFSMMWGRRLAGIAPLYVALQDGMTDEDLERFANAEWVEGIFVGGTLEWKMANGAWLVEWAHKHDLPCHVGRVGTGKRVRWAIQIGADSIDSALPLWSRENLGRFCRELAQPHLFGGTA